MIAWCVSDYTDNIVLLHTVEADDLSKAGVPTWADYWLRLKDEESARLAWLRYNEIQIKELIW